MKHKTLNYLLDGLTHIKKSPKTKGDLQLIVRRPDVDQRELLKSAEINTDEGLIGDDWKARNKLKAHLRLNNGYDQITIMNSRVIERIAGSPEHWPPAGDQLYVDFDLSRNNLPPGTQLKLGSVILEVSKKDHTGCKKFIQRFGRDAFNFVNSAEGKQLCLRGINTRVIRSGSVKLGDSICKL